jgi:(1->4)-alpha-D-glucan 1-alpha-D-glucosylmutase
LLALSTHDNKRSADARARIDVISEVPAAWRAPVRHWRRMNRRHKSVVEGAPAPSANDEYLFYQTLVGTFPAGAVDATAMLEYRERIERYMVKAAREAKVFTSWVNVNADYEAALTTFVAGALEESATNAFLVRMRTDIESFAWFGALNSVSMALLHCTAPGVPDIYQGSELNELSLVDPDNRRPVDYARRRELLGGLQRTADATAHERAKALQAMLASPADGRLKLWMISRALELRCRQPDVFEAGDYAALGVTGARSRHVVAFARRHQGSGAIVIAGRLYASLGLTAGASPLGAAIWDDTRVEVPFPAPAVPVSNVLTGDSIDLAGGTAALAQVFAKLPCALLAW